MIDTVKIFTLVDRKVCEEMSKKMIVRVGIDREKDDLVLYELFSGSVPSYSTSIVVNFSEPAKYGLKPKYFDKMVLSLECSLHKVLKKQNAFGGFYIFDRVVKKIIRMTSKHFDVELPSFSEWYVNKVDIAICKDLTYNKIVKRYINSLSKCSYPRRKVRFFADECLYISGTTTTLKIYNKLLEFRKNDMRKVADFDFDIFTHQKVIDGFVRFECSIKNKKLHKIYEDRLKDCELNFVKCSFVRYDDLYGVWSDEFMKLLKLVNSSFQKVWKKDEVKDRLFQLYGNRTGNTLYTFYTSMLIDGYENTKNTSGSSAFYDKVSKLKKAGIDFSKGIDVTQYSLNLAENDVEFDDEVAFDIFNLKEVI